LSHAGKAWTTSKGLEMEVPGPMPKSIGDILPASILEHVRTTYEPVALDEAVVDPTWTDDPYITANRPRSVVCFPILRQLTIVGIFYLENNSGRGMFTPRRLALLEFLAHQAANSLEHAKLYAALARENTDRRRAEQVLRKSEERLRRLVETTDVIPWEFDGETNTFTFVGVQAEKRFGWPASFWTKPNFLKENVHPDDRVEAIAAFTRACADGKHPGVDFRIIAQDGQPYWLHMVVGLVEHENGQRFLSGFFFDITERKESEQTLRDKLKIIERQKNDIRALSTPLLDVSENIVAMPVFGELDDERAGRIMDVLLDTITKRNIRGAILDLTGVASIGNSTAEHIGRIVRAVELLGARAIVAGIRADVARAIVSLDVGLGRIETRASMKDALRVMMNGQGSRDIHRNQGGSSR
jgi:PAS domain S-box-containing protein